MKNIFGTDGIRGRVGDGFFTDQSLMRLGDALAVWLVERYGDNVGILLAHDTRISSGFIKSVLKSRLLLHKIDLYDAQVLPTPGVFQLIQDDRRFEAGMMISASHNPFCDNGIKLIDAERGKLSLCDEERISELFNSLVFEADYTSLGTERYWDSGTTLYMNKIIKYFPKTFLQHKTVVLDCANGAASKIAPELFEHLGAQVIVMHNQPNGYNINERCGAVHTEHLQAEVVHHGADLGFAFDGDADRVIAVNHQGEVKSGDDILALLLTHPLYKEQETVVGTVMTNKGFEHHINQAGKKLIRTQVGDKHVSALLKKEKLLLGGESSGHIICNDYLSTGDGVFAALRVAEALFFTNNWSMNTFDRYPQIMINVPITNKKDLMLDPCASLIKDAESLLHQGRILVRYSGTESLLRVMVEDDDGEHAQMVCLNLSKELQTVL